MTDENQRIVEKIMRLLILQGGDCRADDYVEGDETVADLLERYKPSWEANDPARK